MSSDMITVDSAPVVAPLALPDAKALKQRIAAIAGLIAEVFDRGIHYGPPFPGSDRDSLLQPGAELAVQAFGLVPRPRIEEVAETGAHRTFLCEGGLHAAGGALVGEMSATCSTLEPKYRYRKQQHRCPSCGQETVYADKKVRGAWYCWSKKGGCGNQFAADSEQAKAIEDQSVGKVEHEDPPELYHTCRMMAQKRWLVAIARRTFGLSARFVDAEGHASALFDWEGRGRELLQALPGERQGKWAAVGTFTLQTFGKEPRSITNLEGAVVMEWLRASAGSAVSADLKPPGLDTAPVAPPTAEPTAAAELLDEATRKNFETSIRMAGRTDEAVARVGLPDGWATGDMETLKEFRTPKK